ncbi:ribosomal large subunit pseudouridylate synthase C [Mycoplasmopsis citelli]|uniref:RNA pseudouridylate synthase n=1 Tax=Mycoplasmopsis citelli TaxID=171281 RepID=A0A449B1W7_9BACT|nr:RluA family pseudouridine synthase [Mycoplasmopsis citelli]VEU74561.1 ribosomal large subunit pseudouridylate synthase C [Mycoplasmopsis citelli]
MFKIVATKNDASRSIFKLLQKYLSNLPLSKIEKIFRKKDLKVNGNRKIDKNYKVNEGDIIVVYGIYDSQKNEQNFNKYTLKNELNIIYEDENILIINKDSGISVHGEENALDNQVLAYLNFKKIDSFTPSHIGRLDKETSGIMVYGKNFLTVKMLNEARSKFIKKYQFLSDFIPKNQEIKLYFYKDLKTQKMKVSPKLVPESKEGITLFYNEANKKIAQILTGRKHQIRLTLKYLNAPIYGDRKYGGKKASRLMLHSWYLKFNGLNGQLSYLNNKEFWCPIKW